MTVNIPPSQQEEDGELPQQASVALKFIVVGSGVGGLVAAIALQDAGHSVLILDSRSKCDVLSETNGESFYIGPNTHRILTRCGVILPKEETWQAGLTSLRRYANGDLLIHLPTETELHDECGGGEFYVATSTLLKYLYTTAIKKGVEVHFESRVTDISPDTSSITVAPGNTLNGDIIVGADGPFSIVRRAVTGEQTSDRAKSFDCTGEYLSFRIKQKDIRDSNFSHLIERGEVHIWLGSNSWVCSYPLRDCEEYCAVAFMTCPTPKSCPNRRREEVPMTDTIRNRFGNYEETVRLLFSLAKTVTSTHWRKAPALDSWVREDGKVVLIGDAAHPSQPTSIASSPGMNLEDGAVLGALYAHLAQRSQIPLLSQTYEDLRTARCKMALDLDIGLLELGCLPDGELQEARDVMFQHDQDKFDRRQGVAEMDSRYNTLWNQRLDIWKYDAWEDVQDWWLRLGRIQQGMLVGSETPVAVRRLSVGVERRIQIASEASSS